MEYRCTVSCPKAQGCSNLKADEVVWDEVDEKAGYYGGVGEALLE